MATSSVHFKYYSRQGLWSLFLMCALPLHIWTIILAFNDFSWISERTSSWDAIGNLSYGLVFTFVESAVIFIAASLLSFLISKKWDEKTRISLTSILIIVLSLWAMVNQYYFLMGIRLPQAIDFFAASDHPLRNLYAATLTLVIPTFVIPVYFVLKSDKFLRFVQEAIERLSLLATVYLFMDAAALIVVIIRNI